MPLYEYQCETHGRFEGFAPLAKSSQPLSCPICETASRRVLSIPSLQGMDRRRMAAFERNEKSRHEPHVCGSGCQHGPPSSKPKPLTPEQKPALQQYKGARPWVVEHG